MKKVSKLILTSLILGVFMSGSVLALWYFDFNGITGYAVRSKEPFKFTSDFSMTEIDVTNSSMTKNNSIDIINRDGATLLNVAINVTRLDTNLTDGCTVEESDCVSQVVFKGVEINDGDSFTAPSSTSELVTVLTVPHRACPHDCTLEVTITP